MALQAAYQQFLAAPNSAALAQDASLHYITSTTSLHGATDIIKHLATLRNQVKKKKQEPLNVVEGKDAIAAEIDTTLEFITSGGAYLPSLDDNFLADRTVHLPIIHIVKFDGEGKIAQIRQSWDQGALLKQLDVIGRTGRNWPIRDSTEQIRLITNSVKAVVAAPAAPASTAASTAPSETSQPAATPLRSRGNSVAGRKHPHGPSVELFASREELESLPAAVVSPYAGSRPRQRDFAEILGEEHHDDPNATPRATTTAAGLAGSVVSPYAGSRPRQRSFTEILGEADDEEGGEEGGEGLGDASQQGSPSNGRGRSRSPSKSSVVAPKIGAGKNFQPMRLFETAEGDEAEADPNTPDRNKSPERSYRPHPTKFNHFDFADGSDPQDAPQPGTAFDQLPKGKHGNHWSFDEFFTTPNKPAAPNRSRAQDVRHWGTENDVVEDTPAKKPVQNKPRRDAETHFELRDDGVPTGEPRPSVRPRGAAHNTGLGLYENRLHAEEAAAAAAGGATAAPADGGPEPRALGNITNIKDRSKIFDPHFSMADDSAHGQMQPKPAASEDRMKVVKMMESNWANFDATAAASQKENDPAGPEKNRGIQIMGDGMGGKKGAGGRGWGIGDDSGDEAAAQRAVPGKKQGAAQKTTGSFWDF